MGHGSLSQAYNLVDIHWTLFLAGIFKLWYNSFICHWIIEKSEVTNSSVYVSGIQGGGNFFGLHEETRVV